MNTQRLLTVCIATVWIINGLFCKVLNLVPRHELIVSRILGDNFSRPITLLIGLSEIGMAIWILSGFKKRINAITQIVIIGSMNILEFLLAPDLLLWGRLNSVFAFLFVTVIYLNQFRFKQIN